jgi:bifunctional non-homologous end joining protein LigD
MMKAVLNFSSPRLRIAQHLETTGDEMLRVAREMGLEGVVAKKLDSRYKAGKRSGSWASFASTVDKSW